MMNAPASNAKETMDRFSEWCTDHADILIMCALTLTVIAIGLTMINITNIWSYTAEVQK